MSLITLPHAIFLYDEDGNPVPIVSGSAITSGSRGFIVYGEDGNGETRQFQVDADGKLAIQDPANLDVALSTRLSETTFTSSINTLGQKNMAGSTPVVLASDQTSIPVTDNGSSLTIDNAFIDANISDLVTEATFTSSVGEVQATPTANTLLGRLKDINDTATTLLTELEFETRVGEVQATPTANTLLGRLKDINDTTSTLLTELEFETRIGEVQATPTANTVLGRLKDINDTNSTLLTEADFDSRVNTLGQKEMTGSTPVVIASDQTSVLVESVISDHSGSFANIVTNGARTALSIEYPALLAEMKLITRELKIIRQHMEAITEEECDGDC